MRGAVWRSRGPSTTESRKTVNLEATSPVGFPGVILGSDLGAHVAVPAWGSARKRRLLSQPLMAGVVNRYGAEHQEAGHGGCRSRGEQVRGTAHDDLLE
jgi:hypothetical protein